MQFIRVTTFPNGSLPEGAVESFCDETEGVSKKSDKEMFGRTSQNKVVVFPAQGIKVGTLVNVKVNDCTSATLMGEII